MSKIAQSIASALRRLADRLHREPRIPQLPTSAPDFVIRETRAEPVRLAIPVRIPYEDVTPFRYQADIRKIVEGRARTAGDSLISLIFEKGLFDLRKSYNEETGEILYAIYIELLPPAEAPDFSLPVK